jgi:lysophospholipase L1-like esterase
MNSVHMALSAGGSSIISGTDKVLTFDGNESVIIPAGQAVISDIIEFEVDKLSNIAITIFFGSVPQELTGHPGSRTTSYIMTGNAVDSQSMSSSVLTEHWYTISGIEVLAEDTSRAVVALGDSITDGRGTTTDGNNRWTDKLAERLSVNADTANVAVLNMGIGGNNILKDGLGPAAIKRFDRDMLEQSGVKYVIVLEGVNDIGTTNNIEVAQDMINAYKTFIAKAHARNIRIYGGTILPFGGSQYDNVVNEETRQVVNKWIRTNGEFDGVIDFDAAVRNPDDHTRLLEIYDCEDHLHLSPQGYKRMADMIDLGLFV